MIGWENDRGAYFINKLQGQINSVEETAETAEDNIGKMSDLTTSSKTTLVGAVNELDALAKATNARFLTDLVSGRASASVTFTVSASARIMLVSFGASTAVCGLWLVNNASSGDSITAYEIKKGTSLTVTTESNKLTLANANAAGMFVRALVFNGTISLDTQ